MIRSNLWIRRNSLTQKCRKVASLNFSNTTGDNTELSDEEHFRSLEKMYMGAPTNTHFQPTLHISHGKAEVRIKVKPDFFHAAGAVHGAYYFKALDDATFFAVNSTVKDVFVLTATFELSLLRPVVSGELIAKASVTGAEGNRIIATGELFDSDGKLVAKGKGKFAKSKMLLSDIFKKTI